MPQSIVSEYTKNIKTRRRIAIAESILSGRMIAVTFIIAHHDGAISDSLIQFTENMAEVLLIHALSLLCSSGKRTS